jgi:hypothetical protein
MKTPIMTTNFTWPLLRNPGFKKLAIVAVISGTCVATHDSAATWMMNTFTGSPLLQSLMSTVAFNVWFATKALDASNRFMASKGR